MTLGTLQLLSMAKSLKLIYPSSHTALDPSRFSCSALQRGVRHCVGGSHAALDPLHEVRTEIFSGQD